MLKLLRKPFAYATVFSVFLMSMNVLVLLKTFVISSVEGYLPQSTENNSVSKSGGIDNAVITDMSYQDSNIKIFIEAVREYETDIYIADIILSSAECLKTALANNAFGNNVTQKTSEIAQANNAILAINGDYYGANSKGYVVKNGVLFRESVRRDSQYDDLVVYDDGTFEIINENDISAQELLNRGVVNLFAFGPALVEGGEVTVSDGEEVSKAMAENPRTSIGIIDELHYIFLVSDGRTSESEGLSLYQTALIMKNYGCIIAYNLDGGGSSTMYFNGKVINNPTTNGKQISERSVSDIVYIGY